ncbi:unnamed protein product [Symbiodinium natans]|uniref:Uncharacterized protein n=1 Tax=Symbiodinium natans TaxID=878477 RepID=A0A812I0V2_9DINO|nr:unnamed protein product [Symbiodinium natans]
MLIAWDLPESERRGPIPSLFEMVQAAASHPPVSELMVVAPDSSDALLLQMQEKAKTYYNALVPMYAYCLENAKASNTWGEDQPAAVRLQGIAIAQLNSLATRFGAPNRDWLWLDNPYDNPVILHEVDAPRRRSDGEDLWTGGPENSILSGFFYAGNLTRGAVSSSLEKDMEITRYRAATFPHQKMTAPMEKPRKQSWTQSGFSIGNSHSPVRHLLECDPGYFVHAIWHQATVPDYVNDADGQGRIPTARAWMKVQCIKPANGCSSWSNCEDIMVFEDVSHHVVYKYLQCPHAKYIAGITVTGKDQDSCGHRLFMLRCCSLKWWPRWSQRLGPFEILTGEDGRPPPCKAFEFEGRSCIASHDFEQRLARQWPIRVDRISTGGYGNHAHCDITVNNPERKALLTIFFKTEARVDVLTVNGQDYSGSTGPGQTAPVIPEGSIVRRTDGISRDMGWLICL